MLECRALKRPLLAFACFAVALVAASPGFAAPGDLDPSFGVEGEFAFQANPACHPFCVELGGSYATALALQRDGKIVLGGGNSYLGAGPGTDRPVKALVRVNPNGTLDGTFGNEGLAEGPAFGVWGISQSDNRLLAVGASELGAEAEEYTEAGLPARAFHLGTKRPATHIFDVKVDSTRRILVLLAAPTGGLEIRRFLPDGAPDPSFGVNGIVQLRRGPATEASAPGVIDERHGKIVVVASIELSSQPTTRRLFFARLTPRGKLDLSFGSAVTAPLPIYSRHRAPTLAIAPDGGVLFATGEDTIKPAGGEHLLLVRYTASGRLDKSFGHGGLSDRVVVHLGQGGGRLGSMNPDAIAFETSGNPIVAGSNDIMTIDTGSAGSWFVARYTRHGLDCSFGKSGLVFGNARGGATAVAIQPDGRIVVAGDREREFMAARYMGGGTPRTCAGEGNPRRRRRRSTRRSPQPRQRRVRAAARAPNA